MSKKAPAEVVQGEDRPLLDREPVDRPLEGVGGGDRIDRRVVAAGDAGCRAVVVVDVDAGAVVATDVSLLAVDLARENAQRAGVEVTNLLGDLLAPVPPALRGRVDVLVANAPYVPTDWTHDYTSIWLTSIAYGTVPDTSARRCGSTACTIACSGASATGETSEIQDPSS